MKPQLTSEERAWGGKGEAAGHPFRGNQWTSGQRGPVPGNTDASEGLTRVAEQRIQESFDSEKREMPATVNLYHGTTDRVIDQIKREGLRPAKPEERLYDDEYYQGDRGNAVYLADDAHHAHIWLKSTQQKFVDRWEEEWEKTGRSMADHTFWDARREYEKSIHPIIVKVKVPKKDLQPDLKGGRGTYYVPRNIPPDWIVDAWDPESEPYKKAEDEPAVVYAVVITIDPAKKADQEVNVIRTNYSVGDRLTWKNGTGNMLVVDSGVDLKTGAWVHVQHQEPGVPAYQLRREVVFADRVTLKGDLPGHPFRGNQYESGRGSDKKPSAGGSTPGDSDERQAGLTYDNPGTGGRVYSNARQSSHFASERATTASREADEIDTMGWGGAPAREAMHQRAADAHADAITQHTEAMRSAPGGPGSFDRGYHSRQIRLHEAAYSRHMDAVSALRGVRPSTSDARQLVGSTAPPSKEQIEAHRTSAAAASVRARSENTQAAHDEAINQHALAVNALRWASREGRPKPDEATRMRAQITEHYAAINTHRQARQTAKA